MVTEVPTSTRVFARDSFGKFIEQCRVAGTETVEDMIEEGAELSRALAPKGHKPDPDPIAESIDFEMLSATSGHWFATSGHAMPQETGAVPHIIRGNPGLKFFWDREGRMFLPSARGVTIVHHPGNPAHPFLRPAYEAIMKRWSSIAKRYYPG